MNAHQATVSKVLTFSVVDGPGNRLVVFLQGCNFNCQACHNPYTIGQCDHCGDCVPACPQSALALVDGRVRFDPGACDHCDICLDVCPISASPMTRQMSVADILAIARENLPFLSGITLSGGEATMQLKFICALFAAVKADPDLSHLSCFVDTNGHLGEKGWARLLPVTDGVMLDIKAFSPARHLTLTGKSSTKTLAAAHLLKQAGKLYEIRVLLAPGQTDGDDEVGALVDFVSALGLDTRVRLNAFQKHGVRGAAQAWPAMPRAGVERVAEKLAAAGIKNVAKPAIYQ